MKQLSDWLAGAAMAAVMANTMAAAGEIPRPEHPRPDMLREHWMTLNGEWQFEVDAKADGEARGLTSGKDLTGKILVPFCPESKLSGLGLGNTQRLKDVWYRRIFDLPAALQGKRLRLHFGAVDYQCWVYLNGRLAGAHIGGNTAFAMDVTSMVKQTGNEVVVKVLDDLWSGLQSGGKQAPNQSEGCVYTRTTGIWQPVWLEAVGSSFIDSLAITPDPDQSRVLLDVTINGSDPDLTINAEAFAGAVPVGTASAAGPSRAILVVDLKEKKLWDPGAPFLYDLKLTLASGKQKIDTLQSYFGLRKVAIDGRRVLINGKPVFQRLILDQGFYPEGLWTAPTEDALKKDIEMSMACGYNGARLHQKVFEPRFLYWADRLGYLVWGEFPNWGFAFKPEGYSNYLNEWVEIVQRDRNHPSIVGWCPFNETGAQSGELQQMVWKTTKALDPTRPALETSGWVHTLPQPEVLDAHDYDGNPKSLRERWLRHLSVTPAAPTNLPARYVQGTRIDRGVPFMVSEIGGIGWATEGGWGYGAGPKNLDEFYARYQGTIDAMLDNPHLFGFCYTQLTDIEQEKNGLYYYDRKPKFDVEKLHAITSRQAAYERGEQVAPKPADPTPDRWKVIVGAVQDGSLCTPWLYSHDQPADGWYQEAFAAANWKSGLAPFGHEPGRPVRTPWTTPDIYLRKSFTYDGGEINRAALVAFHDEDTEIYLNGEKILNLKGFVSAYHLHDVSAAVKKALKNGSNTLAVHTHQTVGGQFIDMALLVE